jgi:polar amino acid transport system substrate-binding protein
MNRRRFARGGLAALAVSLLCACGSVSSLPGADTAARAALAPTGSLRVAVYRGSPTSLVHTTAGEPAGITHDLGRTLGEALGVPVQVVEFPRIAVVIEALQKGQADITFTNASAARQQIVDFTPSLLSLELGYLAPVGGKVRAIDQIDVSGVKVGVTEGSSSQAALSRQFKAAQLVTAPTAAVAQALLRNGQVDAFATNKAILSEMQDNLPGFAILPGRWGLEHMAVAVPKGREAGMPWLKAVTQQLAAEGRLAAMAQRAGLRGLAQEEKR